MLFCKPKKEPSLVPIDTIPVIQSKIMNAYQLALEQGRKELEEAQRQQRLLNLRVSQLEALVTQLQAFISKGETDAPLFDGQGPNNLAPAPEASRNQPGGDVPIWKAIINALNGMKSDFTVPDALKALRRTGRDIPSRNRLNIIRNTLIHKEEVFGRHGKGHYYVRGFENQDREQLTKERVD